jgi:ribonuclease H / adenosylcobalamin/alpha-ribazole phosphatase
MPGRLIVEADGGSRGNPGPAAYGAVVRDGDTGELLAEVAESIGVTTNNVAEYRGVIAGLEAAREIDPEARVDVRLDSKLVVEQMSGRWKIKNPAMQELAAQARSALPRAGVSFTWVPRERNKHADRLVNAALDGNTDDILGRLAVRVDPRAADAEFATRLEFETEFGSLPASWPEAPPSRLVGWGHDLGEPTVLVLLRHGETAHTRDKRFSGSGGEDPGLSEAGQLQSAAAARFIAGTPHLAPSLVVSSPLRRARETAAFVAEAVGCPVDIEPGFAECAFGEWEGFTFAEVEQRWPDQSAEWLASSAVPPPGGESIDSVEARVGLARARLLARRAGSTVVVVSHVTPIKSLVREALAAPLQAIYRMELGPASVSTIAYFPEGSRSMRSFNETTHLDGLLPHRHV